MRAALIALERWHLQQPLHRRELVELVIDLHLAEHQADPVRAPAANFYRWSDRLYMHAARKRFER